MKKIIFFIIILVIIGFIGGYIYLRSLKKPIHEIVIVKRGNVIQEVSVTGRVKPAREVNLAFEKSGRVARVYVKVGDKVRIRQTLVILENTDLKAQLLQAQANLQTEQAELDELKRGTRPEEIKTAETKVANAERSLKDAEASLENVKKKAEADLQNVYDTALTTAQKSASLGKSALLTLSDLQYIHFIGTDQESLNIAETKAKAVLALLGASSAGRWTTQQISVLDKGAFGTVQTAVINPAYENIDQAVSETLAALREVKKALDILPITSSFTATQKTNLDTEKTNITTEITTLSTKQQAVAVQKVTNANAIASAEASVNTAKNTLASAEDDLSLKKAGTVPEKIVAQEATIKSAQANVLNYEAQLAKTILYSPLNGLITREEAKVGEIVSANTSIVSLISEARFEVEANVPEADLAKVKIGDSAKITLDAYGSEVVFEAKVISIDPAETMIEGVATYKVKLQFEKEDSRIKPGFTANIDISTDQREGVLVIPQRTVMTKNGDKIVLIDTGQPELEERKIETGLRGTDGNLEVLVGVQEGERIIVDIKR